MKKPLHNILICLITISLTSCFSVREYVIDYDYSFNGKFADYQTFSFLNEVGREGDPSYFNQVVEDYIRQRMKTQGYIYTDNKYKTDLLLSYRLFYGNMKAKAYDQPNLEEWVEKTSNKEEDIYRPVEYEFQKGTMYVFMLDQQSEEVVWQGYANGLIGNPDFFDKNEIKRVIWSIFNQYKLLASGFEQY